MARLILSLDGQTLAEYNMTKERYTVGRLPDNDVRIDNAAVSGHHSLIINILNDSFLEDLNSTNGTYVNGKLIKKHALQQSDVITVGHHQLRYVDDRSEHSTPQDEFEKTMVIEPSGQMEEQVAKAALAADEAVAEEAAINEAVPAVAALHTATIAAEPIEEPAAERVAVAASSDSLAAYSPTSTQDVDNQAVPVLPQAKLQVLSGTFAGRELELTKALTTLGRPGVQVAAITRRAEGYFIVHVESGEQDNYPHVNGSQIGPFTESWSRFFVRGELELRMRGANRAALGVRYEDVSRDLDFPEPGNLRILPENAHVRRDTRIVTVYGRTALRPWRRLNLSAELGYRTAPDTGYIVELDDNFYGRLRASYVFRWRRPLSLSAFAQGSTGDNGDFSVVSGLGPDPAGISLGRSLERSNVAWGVTGSLSPVDRLSPYLSFFWGHDTQDTGLDLSNLQRYFQEVLPIGFETDGKSEFENQQLSLILGSHLQLTEQTDGRLSYGYTHAKAHYRGDSANISCLISGSSCLGLIAPNRKIDSDIHTIDLEVGHWLREGLRVLAGYRLQLYDDGSPVVQSVASVVQPFDRSAQQHTVTLGITLTSDFFAR